ncbi:hypothetical protein Ahy_B10g106454 isoform H [Arachis hypogaea]|uniref:Uncharacterized protein n=1 Tax=Arachis hypogaea TaxID=3818 RepID=A0A444XAY0_ARAHY|nr:hypothetical protein Ahy_B10g106454 isoform H [Arachis hypogaea]
MFPTSASRYYPLLTPTQRGVGKKACRSTLDNYQFGDKRDGEKEVEKDGFESHLHSSAILSVIDYEFLQRREKHITNIFIIIHPLQRSHMINLEHTKARQSFQRWEMFAIGKIPEKYANNIN